MLSVGGEKMDGVLYFFILGMFCWAVVYFFFPYLKGDLEKIKNDKEPVKERLSSATCFAFYFFITLTVFFVGLILVFSALSMVIIWLSTVMFNSLSPKAIEYKDFLDIFVHIISIFGTVIIATFAYLFKKKS